MSGRGDERATRALEAALAKGPCDVLDLLDALRRALGDAIELREGAIHPLLHRALRAGSVRVVGFSDRGLPLYAARDDTKAHGAGEPAALPGPLPDATSRKALLVVSGLRDPAARGRVQADAVAHLQALAEADAGHRFGSPRSVRSLLQRVDRGRPTVCLPVGGGDLLRRFALHEGPWIAGAVLIFILLKAFVVQVYRIPSKSMVPTLTVGDRVVVFRLGNDAPQRWQIVVYERDGVTYVKRVIGLPGEAIELRNGDVYADGRLLVKPDDLRAAMREPLHSWDFTAGTPPSWYRNADGTPMGPRTWHWNGTAFDPHPEGAGAFGLRDGYLTLDVVRGRRGKVALILRRGPGDRGNATVWTLEVGVQGLELREAEEFDGEAPIGEILASAPGVTPTGDVRLELSYVDGVLRARCGAWSWAGARAARDEALVPEVHLRGPGTSIRRLSLDRDLHYAYMGSHGVPGSVHGDAMPHRVAEDALFMLGDNTTGSLDSRSPQVGDIPLGGVVGPLSFRIWPPTRIGGVR